MKASRLRSVFLLILALIMIMSLASCNKAHEGGEETEESTYETPAAETPLEGSDEPKEEYVECKHEFENSRCIHCGEKFWRSKDLHFLSNGDGTCRVSGIGKCNDLKVVIPIRSTKGEPVVEIGYRAFAWYEEMESIIIHEGITVIGESAFHDCLSLRSAVFEDPEGWYCNGKPVDLNNPALNVSILLNGEKLEKR